MVIKLSNSEGRTPLNGGGGLFGGAQFDEEGDPRRLPPQDPNVLGRHRVLYNRSAIDEYTMRNFQKMYYRAEKKVFVRGCEKFLPALA